MFMIRRIELFFFSMQSYKVRISLIMHNFRTENSAPITQDKFTPKLLTFD